NRSKLVSKIRFKPLFDADETGASSSDDFCSSTSKLPDDDDDDLPRPFKRLDNKFTPVKKPQLKTEESSVEIRSGKSLNNNQLCSRFGDLSSDGDSVGDDFDSVEVIKEKRNDPGIVIELSDDDEMVDEVPV